jgi:serine/threonine protein kinase
MERMSHEIGQVVGGRYEIQGLLTPQAVGELYRALQKDANQAVLLLTLGPTLLPDEAARQQFVKKVGLARGLRAPNLIPLLEVRAEGDVVVLAAQWVAADTLRDRLDRRHKEMPGQKGLPASEAIAVLAPIAQAVLQLHGEGEVLGDLRPETVFITVDGIKLFNHGVGMALPREKFIKAFERSGDITSVAPETQEGRTVGTRADVFSLAAIAWELFFGEPPPYVGSPHDDTPVGEVLRRSLDPEPRERPLNVEVFLRELQEAVAKPVPAPKPAEPAAPAESPAANPFGEASTREINLAEIQGLLGDENQNTTRQINLNEIEGLLAKTKDEQAHAAHSEPAAAPTPAPAPAPTVAPTIAPTISPVAAPSPAAQPSPPFAPEITGSGIQLTPAEMKTGAMLAVDFPPSTSPEVAGNMPPPTWEEVQQARAKKKPIIPILAAVVILGAAAFGAYKYATGGIAEPPPAPTPAPQPPAPPPTPPAPVPAAASDGAATAAAAPAAPANAVACPLGMTRIPGDKPVCIDQYEFPGDGFPPRASVSFVEALQLCNGKGARMCTAGEWERACRGPAGANFPYGATFSPKACNTKAPGSKVASAGSFPECKSAVGAFDMVGNVAEWVLVDAGQVPAQKGGSAQSAQTEARCDNTVSVSALGGGPLVGFRCCKDAQ